MGKDTLIDFLKSIISASIVLFWQPFAMTDANDTYI